MQKSLLKMKNKTVNNLAGICISLFFAMMIGGTGELLEWSGKDQVVLYFFAFMASMIYWFMPRANSGSDDEWDAE